MNWKKLLRLDDASIARQIPPNTHPPAPPRPRKEIQISMGDMSTMAQAVAKSGMFGVKDEAQALSLMLLCQAEGLHPVLALRRYHIIEGKPSMRADALQGEFERTGAILWHERHDTECAATFFSDKRQVTVEAVRRARLRYETMKAGRSVASLAEMGEMTIIRTLEDAIEKKVAMSWKDNRWQMKHNWKQSPRQMLHARCLSEGVRAIAPGLIAGIYTEDEVLDEAQADSVPSSGEMTAQDKVEAATANRLAIEDDKIDISPVGPVTEENCNEVVCHIGKAQGDMLGKTVAELHPKVLQWLSDHYGEGNGIRWGNPPTEKDERLKTAVDLALKKLNE